MCQKTVPAQPLERGVYEAHLYSLQHWARLSLASTSQEIPVLMWHFDFVSSKVTWVISAR